MKKLVKTSILNWAILAPQRLGSMVLKLSNLCFHVIQASQPPYKTPWFLLVHNLLTRIIHSFYLKFNNLFHEIKWLATSKWKEYAAQRFASLRTWHVEFWRFSVSFGANIYPFSLPQNQISSIRFIQKFHFTTLLSFLSMEMSLISSSPATGGDFSQLGNSYNNTSLMFISSFATKSQMGFRQIIRCPNLHIKVAARSLSHSQPAASTMVSNPVSS